MARTRKTHTVIRGCLEGKGPTKREALIDLNKQVDWACQYNPVHTEIYFGHVIIIAPCAYGYMVQVLCPDQLDGPSKIQSFRQFVGRAPIETEIRRQRLHVAQLAWHPDMSDSMHLVEADLDDQGSADLASWMRFQRLYTAHKAAGATDGQAHERACRGEAVAA